MNETVGYVAELARLDAEISRLRDLAPAQAASSDARRLAYLRYQDASLRGDFRRLHAVDTELKELLRRTPGDSDLLYLKANVAFKFHCLEGVQHALDASPVLAASAAGRGLAADLKMQQGRYADARADYDALIEQDRSWDHLARLAHLLSKLGDTAEADRIYAEAEDELSAKEMRHFAWVELQRGVLDLSAGRVDEAGAHYVRAERAYPGYWMVAEHRAEYLAASGDWRAAAMQYERVIEEVERPELMQALGELYEYTDETAAAGHWLDAAERAYFASVDHGEVHYLHHLADFFSDVRVDGEQAIRWAGQDLALRENPETLAAWSWALYRAGRCAEAVMPMERALASGWVDAHGLARAAAVMSAAGRDGEALAARAQAMHPHVHGFHVHR